MRIKKYLKDLDLLRLVSKSRFLKNKRGDVVG